MEQTRRTLAEAALARVQEGARERALHGLRPQPAPVTAPPPHTQQPGTTPGRTTGGVA
ncbi:hypothetical protein ACI2LO_31505 [Streptomyces sp. NPDC033754]|uniref:hypothetical protein n=1 Tax=unclassified Streptomyces TaxID=2593676 RepID=UPI0033F3016E